MKCANFYGPLVIAGYPGVGKSHAYNSLKKDIHMHDSDSSQFSKDKNWPNNYIDHIEQLIAKSIFDCKYSIIFVSTHKEVLEELARRNIRFTVVYPSIDLQDEYIRRYEKRNSPESFIKLMKEKWTEFHEDIDHFRNKNSENILIDFVEFINKNDTLKHLILDNLSVNTFLPFSIQICEYCEIINYLYKCALVMKELYYSDISSKIQLPFRLIDYIEYFNYAKVDESVLIDNKSRLLDIQMVINLYLGD